MYCIHYMHYMFYLHYIHNKYIDTHVTLCYNALYCIIHNTTHAYMHHKHKTTYYDKQINYSNLHTYQPALHCIASHYIALQYITLHSTPFQSFPLYYIHYMYDIHYIHTRSTRNDSIGEQHNHEQMGCLRCNHFYWLQAYIKLSTIHPTCWCHVCQVVAT